MLDFGSFHTPSLLTRPTSTYPTYRINALQLKERSQYGYMYHIPLHISIGSETLVKVTVSRRSDYEPE